ncbi:DUF4177 domain-containing protein [Sulfitobacter mediterraneus]|uniref:DUF4177 domain-containing protein n=1 Tax=Sulfitobacter mediterraneus TaxID=83219 RepID=UPI000EA19840|nr:DUF4177 domain-containing protein [Sulfitobacter mediterraneus]
MPRYEYKVVPAPTKGLKAKGLKTPEARFSNALQALMNTLGGDGWEYQRAETLPSVERSGLTSSTTEWRHVLVFRRALETQTETFTPELLPAPVAVEMPKEPASETPQKAEVSEAEKPAKDAPEKAEDEALDAPEEQPEKPVDNPLDNGVEDTDDVAGIGSPLEVLAKARNKTKSDD